MTFDLSEINKMPWGLKRIGSNLRQSWVKLL